MKKFLNLLLILTALTAFGQDAPDGQGTPDLYFDSGDFGERFAVMTESDEVYLYLVTDLTQFTSLTQKHFFLNSIYSDNYLISIDSDISDDQLWFKAPLAVSEGEVVCALENYRDKAIKSTEAMTEAERAAWLDNHKKLQTKND